PLADDAPLPTRAGLEKALAPYVGRSALGAHGGVSVRDVATGRELYGKDSGGAYLPASTTKVLTAAAVLSALGPDHRFQTTVVTGAEPGRIVLVGGGDPLLATKRAWSRHEDAVRDRQYPVPATIDELAARTAKRLASDGQKTVSVRYDESLFAEKVSPHWRSIYVSSGVVAPISALWVDEAKLEWPARGPRSDDPPSTAAKAFVAALERNGVTVTGTPTAGKAPADARALASVASPPLSRLVEQMLLTSDNDSAEVLARHVAVADGRPVTFAGMSEAILARVRKLGADVSRVRLHDGSGLSRDNRIPPSVLTQVLTIAADDDHPELRSVLTGLPVAAYSGSLSGRYLYAGEDGAGLVRAKTGTLTGVSTLAGIVPTKDGALLAFSVMSDRGAPVDPRIGIDRAAAALTACGCR
ncbi:MAG TPA: D-alanyl-D-alanine carboxypeptidase/D-alanyl-D-alanine-endopeptidase, partial [Actinopolymorphaceae bacterium]